MTFTQPEPTKLFVILAAVSILTLAHLWWVSCLPKNSPDQPDYPTLFIFSSVGRIRALSVFLLSLLAGWLVSWLEIVFVPAGIILASSLLVLCAVDGFTTWLPKPVSFGITIQILVCFLISATFFQLDFIHLVPSALLCAGLGAGIFFIAFKLGGLASGDIILIAQIGAISALAGTDFWLASLFCATTLGVLTGLVIKIFRKKAKNLDGFFAYGPVLLAGPFLAGLAQATRVLPIS